MYNNIAIIGASGSIGIAFTKQLGSLYPNATIHVFSQKDLKVSAKNTICHLIDYKKEASLKAAAAVASKEAQLDMVIVTTGILHVDGIMPEKALRELSAEKFRYLFEAYLTINLVVGMLIVHQKLL